MRRAAAAIRLKRSPRFDPKLIRQCGMSATDQWEKGNRDKTKEGLPFHGLWVLTVGLIHRCRLLNERPRLVERGENKVAVGSQLRAAKRTGWLQGRDCVDSE